MVRRRAVPFLLLTLLVSLAVPLAAQSTGIQVEAQYSGVKVYVNGTYQKETTEDPVTGKIYCRITLAPGTYRIRCEYVNYQPAEDTVTVPPDAGFVKHKVTFATSQARSESIDKTQSTATVQTGTIFVRSVPSDAGVELDGRQMGDPTDCKLTDVPVGLRKVRVYFPKISLDVSFRLRAGETVTVTADFSKKTIRTDAKYAVNFDSVPSGGTLFVNDRPSGTLPVRLTLEAGRYAVRIEKEDFQAFTDTLEVNGDDFINPDLARLVRKVTISGNPAGGSVYLTDPGPEKFLGTAPLEIPVDPGKYKIRIEKKDRLEYRPVTMDVEVARSDRAKAVSYSLVPVAARITGEADPDYMPPGARMSIAGMDAGEVSGVRDFLVAPGKQKVTIAGKSFSYAFKDGVSYRIRPLFPIPVTDKPIYTAANVPGRKDVPPEPKYRSESVRQYAREPQFFGPMGMLGALGGAVGGALLAGAAKLSSTGIGTAVVLGGALGWLSGALFDPSNSVASGTTPDNDAIAANAALRTQWQKQKAEAEAYNARLLESANASINAENARARDRNKGRGVAVVLNVTESRTETVTFDN